MLNKFLYLVLFYYKFELRYPKIVLYEMLYLASRINIPRLAMPISPKAPILRKSFLTLNGIRYAKMSGKPIGR